jgi:hypothetical protein
MSEVKDRRIDGLPNEGDVIWIKPINTKEWVLCKWTRIKGLLDLEYLGTALTIGRDVNIGFNAWSSNDYEFIYWQKVEKPE